MMLLSALVLACTSVSLTGEEIEYIRNQQTSHEEAPLGAAHPGRTSLIARGETVLPCLQEIYLRGWRDPQEGGTVNNATEGGSWTLYLMREIDPSVTRELIWESLKSMSSSDKRILRLSVMGYWLGLQGQEGRESAAGRVVQYMDQCKDPDDMMDVIQAISLINKPGLKWAVKARLDKVTDDPPEVRQGLQFLFWALSRDLQLMKNEIQTNPHTSRYVATLLCNIGQAWMVDQIVKEGSYPEGVDLPGVLKDARRRAIDLGDELAIAGTWP